MRNTKLLIKKAVAFGISSILMGSMLLTGCSSDNDNDNDNTENESNGDSSADAVETNYSLTIDDDISKLDGSYDISELLYGLFLEDINFAVDGGMYAEMIKNRSFEYANLATNTHKHGWSISANTIQFEVVDGAEDNTCLNSNNTHYAVVENTGTEWAGIGNSGYLDGIAVEEGAEYKVTGYLKGLDGYTGSVRFLLTDKKDGSGTVIGEGELATVITGEWQKYEMKFTATKTASSGLYFIVMLQNGKAAMDMISVFPTDTFMGRENGIRKDIGEYLAAVEPKFLRFPGGCVVEGKTYESQYNWKDSIGNALEFTINGEVTVGDVAARPQGIDIWADLNKATANPYYTTYGMGFYEYFLLCEDLNCLAVPILNAGMLCPIQSPAYDSVSTNSDEFKQYIQDALDLVEFCRGDASTTWGAVRIAMGHEEPFELKYIGIGNEQWQSEYYHHYGKFVEAFDKAAEENSEMYGDIELIVANGPVSSDRYGWDAVYKNGELDYAALVDEHFYQTPAWFLSNTERYDSYERDTTKVFLGEYAAKSNNWNAALAESAFMTALERNGDVVEMACYAPLFGNGTQTQWTPDMIWFDNDEVFGSVNYYIQKMFSTNQPTTELKTEFVKGTTNESQLSGAVGIGTWATEAEFDDIKVVDNDSGEILYEQSFDDKAALDDGNIIAGDWSVENGVAKQSYTGNTKSETTGDVAIFGSNDMRNYTFTCKAKKLSGAEGFIIPVAVGDKGNMIFWNIGGWGNTVSCLQIVEAGAKSDQVAGTVRDCAVKTNEEYEIKIVVEGNNIKCYMNENKLIDYTHETGESLYQTVGTDETDDIIIKLVNVKNSILPLDISIPNIDDYNTTADVIQMASDSAATANSFNEPEKLIPEESTMEVSGDFTYDVPAYSVTIIRIHKK